MDDLSLKKKVLFLTSWYPSNHNQVSGIFVQRHAEAISIYFDVAVLYISIDSEIAHKIINIETLNGILTYHLILPVDLKSNVIFRNIRNHYYYNFYLNAYLAYREIIKIFGNPDLIHVNVMFTDMTNMGFFAILLRLFHRRKYLLTEHSTEFIESSLSIEKTIMAKCILSLSSKITPVSIPLQKALMNIKSGAYEIIPNVVDTTFFCPIQMKRADREIKQILHVSLLDDKQKNVSGLIQAIHVLRKKRSDFELHIVGNGRDRKYLESISREFDPTNTYITFHGSVDLENLRTMFQNSDILIVNSFFETFGVVIIEALSCGTPVISTRCGGPEDIITPEVGSLIDIGKPSILIDEIDKLLDNLEKYNPMDLHRYVEERYSKQIIGKKIFSIYMQLLEPC